MSLRRCNRTACQGTSVVWWWNQSTCAWYCETCAMRINDASWGGTPWLCIPEYNLPKLAPEAGR